MVPAHADEMPILRQLQPTYDFLKKNGTNPAELAQWVRRRASAIVKTDVGVDNARRLQNLLENPEEPPEPQDLSPPKQRPTIEVNRSTVEAIRKTLVELEGRYPKGVPEGVFLREANQKVNPEIVAPILQHLIETDDIVPRGPPGNRFLKMA